MKIDLVTVFHNDTNHAQHLDLQRSLREHEPAGGYRFIAVDNRHNNRGFARACNLGAFHPQATAPLVGFLNPDATVEGPFIADVQAALTGPVVITGCRYGKPGPELANWGVADWVCGATLFTRRPWFTSVRGFDEQFVWSHEETDLIRRAQEQGLSCRSIELPIHHQSPEDESPEDLEYKRVQFAQAQRRFYRRWRH
jgi:GT2 family glycosyltransferase